MESLRRCRAFASWRIGDMFQRFSVAERHARARSSVSLRKVGKQDGNRFPSRRRAERRPEYSSGVAPHGKYANGDSANATFCRRRAREPMWPRAGGDAGPLPNVAPSPSSLPILPYDQEILDAGKHDLRGDGGEEEARELGKHREAGLAEDALYVVRHQ